MLHKSNLLVSPDVIGFHEHQISPLVSHFVTNDGHAIADVERLSGDQVNQFDVSFLQNENDEMFIHGQSFNGVTRFTDSQLAKESLVHGIVHSPNGQPAERVLDADCR